MLSFGRSHAASNLHRDYLTQNWQLGSTAAGRVTTPQALQQATVDWIDTTVPATAASSLRHAKRWSLDDEVHNFDADDWWYRLHFQSTAAQPGEQLILCFGGLATVADVWLNEQPLLHSDNMYRSHHCDVSALLRDDNVLLIRFSALDSLLAMKRPRPRWKAPMIQHQQLRWLRTTLLGRTPGWSPPAAAVGPWREVWLERHRTVRIEDLQLDSTLHNDEGSIQFSIQLTPLQSRIKAMQCELQVSRDLQHFTVALQADSNNRHHGTLRVKQPTLWWPHTHGEPALYQAKLCVTITDDTVSTQNIEIELGRTGFRRIELDTKNGNFAITVNGVPVFCRGPCWTPPDVVALNSTQQQLEHGFRLIRDAGMNMIRVGGTMVYENDEFLDLCDANGILLWQDLMFANMDYPETAEFVAEVTAEIREQVSRLNGRPCLAVLCGNSEGEQQAAMFGATRDRWNPALFHQTIPTLLATLFPDIPYWPSSAHGGSFPHQNNVGTTSYYGVGAYMRPLADARRSELRFATECLAFANVPEDSCIERMPGGLALRTHHPQWKIRTPRDLGAGWDFEDVRDFYLQQLFDINPMQLRYANHGQYLELSRVVSGEVMTATFNEWRRGDSRCHGALVWFWQDLWRGAGWGLLDADGQPKSCYYYLRRALQPIAVSFSDEGCNGVFIHLCNDTESTINTHLIVSLYQHSEHPVATGNVHLELGARSTQQIAMTSLFEYFADHNHAYRFGPAGYNLLLAKFNDANGALLAEASYLPLGHRLPENNDLGLSAQVTRHTEDRLTLTLGTRAFARSVTIQAEGFTASDQYFNIAPHSSREIGLQRVLPGSALRGSIKAINTSSVLMFPLDA